MTFSLLFNIDSSEKNDRHQAHDEVAQFHDHDFQPANRQTRFNLKKKTRKIKTHFKVFFLVDRSAKFLDKLD